MKRQEVLESLINDAGWVLVRQRNHKVWRCPCGKHTFVNGKSNGQSGIVNAVARFRKIKRQCKMEGVENVQR